MLVFQLRQGQDSTTVKSGPEFGTQEWKASMKQRLEAVQNYLQKAEKVGPLAKDEKEFQLFQLRRGLPKFCQDAQTLVSVLLATPKKDSDAVEYAAEKLNSLYAVVSAPDFEWAKAPLPKDAPDFDVAGCIFALGKVGAELGLSSVPENRPTTTPRNTRLDLSKAPQPAAQNKQASPVTDKRVEGWIDKLPDKNKKDIQNRIAYLASKYKVPQEKVIGVLAEAISNEPSGSPLKKAALTSESPDNLYNLLNTFLSASHAEWSLKHQK